MDTVTYKTRVIVTAQNGFSFDAMEKAIANYCKKNPDKKSLFDTIALYDAAMYVKMSSNNIGDTIDLRPGGRWVFGRYGNLQFANTHQQFVVVVQKV